MPYPTKRTSSQQTIHFDRRPDAGRHKCRPLRLSVMFIVGDDACDISLPLRYIPFKCGANQLHCRGGACSSRNLSVISPYHAKQINFSVGYGACRRTENGGRFCDRKREIEEKRFCHTGGASPSPTNQLLTQKRALLLTKRACIWYDV